MKLEHLALAAVGAFAAYKMFFEKSSTSQDALSFGGSPYSLGTGAVGEYSSAFGGTGEGSAAFMAATQAMAQSFQSAGINPALMQAKYDELYRNGVYAAAALQNVPTNQYTRDTPTGTGEAIGTVGVIAPKYTQDSTIFTSSGNYFTTDSVGNVVHDSSAIINETARAADVATAGMSGAAKVEAMRQYELAKMGRHD